jgi:hypothetical protein
MLAEIFMARLEAILYARQSDEVRAEDRFVGFDPDASFEFKDSRGKRARKAD